MTPQMQKAAQVQQLLGVTPDGIPGAQTEAAWQQLRSAALAEYRSGSASGKKMLTSPGWNFAVQIDGLDLLVIGTTATWFGGDADPLDNGETASGRKTKGNPEILGCALPVLPFVRATADSPFTKMKFRIGWETAVVVESGGKSLEVVLIDNGPAKSAGDGIDLTVAAFKFFAPLKQGVIPVNYRIRGGGAWV